MLKIRKINEMLGKDAKIIHECSPAATYNKCTHIQVLAKHPLLPLPPGLYEYRLNGLVFNDDAECMSTKNKLVQLISGNKIKMLHHPQSYDEQIKKEE